MKKAWKFIGIVVSAAIIIGVLCMGVGLITGADLSRIFSLLDERYHIQMYYEYLLQVIQAVLGQTV